MTTYRNTAPSPALTRKENILGAIRKASEVRHDLGIGTTEPLCAADVAQSLNVEVLYRDDLASMEGLYIKNPKPRILVSALRPAGRQAFTVAHELGHHIYGHKGHVLPVTEDELEAINRYAPEEIQADTFAAHLLMPKRTIMSTFKARGLDYTKCTPVDLYTMAWWLGVGYETLLRHLQSTLRLITPEYAMQLRRSNPKKIRASLLGRPFAEDIIPVDFHWTGNRPIDAQVGDLIFLPRGTVVAPESNIVSTGRPPESLWGETQTVMQALRPGIARLIHEETGWAVYIRIARRQYAGLARYRYLEDEDEVPDGND